MRTTIELDPDVDARVRALARERGVPLRVVINDELRSRLRPLSKPTPYTLPTKAMGVMPGVNLDKALALAAELEDEEIVRKMELGK